MTSAPDDLADYTRDGQITPPFVIELQITNYSDVEKLNYKLQITTDNGEITKLQISNCKLLQITNYKFRFNSLQVCSMVFLWR